jgi:polyisoprenoid-binding protein YceI
MFKHLFFIFLCLVLHSIKTKCLNIKLKFKSMKFRNLFFALAATVALYSCNSEKPAETSTSADSAAVVTYNVIPDSSTVSWKGDMLKMYSHWGTIKLTEGSLVLKGNALTGGTFTIDMKSVNPLDSGYTKDHPKEGLIGHLSSPDFFLSDSFPTATFVIKSVEGSTATGDLTLRGKTNEEKVTDIVVTSDSTSATASGKLVFNRQKYGVAYVADKKKDMVLSDDITITVALKAKK